MESSVAVEMYLVQLQLQTRSAVRELGGSHTMAWGAESFAPGLPDLVGEMKIHRLGTFFDRPQLHRNNSAARQGWNSGRR